MVYNTPMFVRVTSTPNSPRKAVKIVHSERRAEGVRQVIVRHLGVAEDDREVEQLRQLGKFLIAQMELGEQGSLFTPGQVQRQLQDSLSESAARPRRSLPVDLVELRERQRVVRGIHEVYGRMYDQLGLSELLPATRYPTSNGMLKEVVMARLARPASKLSSVRYLRDQMGLRLNVSQVYRMMDHLDDVRVARLNALAADRARELLPPPVDVYFFDCTTLYFESFVSDELKAPGYSKDGKFKESQVLLALMVTEHGLPVQYQVLPGQTFEGHSLKKAVDDFRRHTPLRRAVVVADRGMLSEDNLATLRKADIDYVVGARLKALPKSLTQRILDPDRYLAPDDDGSRIAVFDQGDDRLVVHWSPTRARKDGHDRDRQIDKLKRKLKRATAPKAYFSSHGYGRFLDVEGGEVTLNEAKIDEARRWDGLHGVRTNLDDETPDRLLDAYRGLWQVEQTFRVTKHDLRVRPIFHWTPRRVKAHIAINFIALLCTRHLEYRCAIQYRRLSPEVIQNSLLNMQQSILEDLTGERRYVIPSRAATHASRLYQLVGAKASDVPFELID